MTNLSHRKYGENPQACLLVKEQWRECMSQVCHQHRSIFVVGYKLRIPQTALWSVLQKHMFIECTTCNFYSVS